MKEEIVSKTREEKREEEEEVSNSPCPRGGESRFNRQNTQKVGGEKGTDRNIEKR